MKKQLMRSRKNTMIAGVCGGIAEFFNIDVLVVRLLWVVSAMFDGPGLIVYIICAILIPKAPREYKHKSDEQSYDDEDDYTQESSYIQEDKKERSKNYMALGFIGIGIYLAIKIIFPWLNFKFLWPVGLIILGFMLLNRERETEVDHDS